MPTHAMTMHAFMCTAIYAAVESRCIFEMMTASGHDARHPDTNDSPHASKHIRMADAHPVQDTADTDAAVMRLLSSKPVR